MIVHQLLSGAGPVDAVTSQARAFRSLFSAWGWGGRDHAASIDPRMGGEFAPLRDLRAAPEDLLLLHYSAHWPRPREILELPNRKLLLSHNVTPEHWLWDHDPVTAVRCALGRKHLPAFVAAADVTAAVSRFNARELEAAGAVGPRVIPVIFEPGRLGAPGRPSRAGPAKILFVGRLAPHKRQDAVIRAFALYRRRHDPEARLMLVGEPLTPRYGARIRELADALAPGAVTIESGLSASELGARYRAADVFLCLSEHEGFCVPLLEAFHFGVPVIARASGAVPEVAGDGALLVEQTDLAVVAELIALATRDGQLRGELVAHGRRRLDAYRPEVTAALLRETLAGLARRPRIARSVTLETIGGDRALESAVIELDPSPVVATRRWGRPISLVKRAVLAVLRQYLGQLESQQTRSNVHLLAMVVEQEARLARVQKSIRDQTGGKNPMGPPVGARTPEP